MASDSDGSTSSSVVLRSIREKLVQYKESLLRQLEDEREAREREDAGEDGRNSVAEQETAHDQQQTTEAVDANAEAEAEEVQSADDGDTSVEVAESAVEMECDKSAAGQEIVEKPSPAKTTEDEAVLKKRRLEVEIKSAAQIEKDAIPTKKAKRSKAKNRQPEESVVRNGGQTDAQHGEPATAVGAMEGQEPVLQGAPYHVVRTSVPPNKYLMQKSREEASDLEARRHEEQPILSTSPAPTSNGVPGVRRPALTPRSSSVSADLTNTEFERKLRESVRLYRDVNNRSLTVTRKRQLPRLPTPARGKSHWDFLLDEMKWMATDFAQERNWKRVMQHRLAADVIVAQNAESIRQEQENRQMARGVALQVSAFWRTMERIAARSRVRFEAAGTDPSGRGETDDPMSGDHVAKSDDADKREDVDMTGADNGAFTLKYHTIDVAARSASDAEYGGKGRAKAETVLSSAKRHMTYIVSAGKRARSAMSSSSTVSTDADKSAVWSLREAAFRELQTRCSALQTKGGPTIILAAFQLLALRWMLDLYSSGLNIFLNDQLGMGKAATIVAFLSLIEIVSSQKQQQHSQDGDMTHTEAISAGKPIGPHLIIVSEEELHKWRYYLRIWHPNRRVQLYSGGGDTSSNRVQMQREWKIKPRAQAHKSEADFLIAPPTEDEDEDELDEGERAEPVFCVLCPVNAFAEDREAFVEFTNWQMVVVENEHGGDFVDPACVAALQRLRQHQRRILCNGQSLENWKNTAVRLQYAEFLVREAPAFETSSTLEKSQHRMESWPVHQLQVERASVTEVMHLYGKSASVGAALWKASSQQEDTSQYMNALLLALSCLSLRRVRSEVEPELGKIEEISMSCQLTLSQQTQYRNALSGFAATLDTSSGREERLGVWLQLLLRLREICNCVDITKDMDKLGHADLRLLTSSSAKLEALEPLLRRLALQEGKKVVVYCQFSAMFPILELFLTLLDISYVRVTGSIAMQRRALCHFADRPVVRVALVSTRLSIAKGRRAVSVFGSEAIIVVDSDWNATCDAKLRASWAKMTVGGADTLPVYRLHCENTVEASLLRVGASLSEKVFGEMTPQELLAVPSNMALNMMIEKPSWWSSTASSSGGNGLTGTGTMAKLATVAQQVEKDEKFCGDSSELEMPLIVHDVDLDADEHLLLANTDELTPVEWYAVNYVHGVTDNKQQQGGEGKAVERDVENIDDESWNDSNAFFQAGQRSFESMAAVEAKRLWQDGGNASKQLFYKLEPGNSGVWDANALEKLFMRLRMEGMETHFDVYQPPQPPSPEAANLLPAIRLSSEAGSASDHLMTFRVSYRVPAPPPPAPLSQPGKSKLEHAIGHGDTSKLTKSSKKQRTTVAGMAGARTGMGLAPGGATAGVKRKLESQLGGIKSGPHKEQRVDLEGIPVPDVSEFADDDFWGDTNLDALDSAEWDDPALLSGILGAGVGAGVSSTASSTGTASSGAGASAASGASGGAGTTTGAGGHAESKSQKGSKKSKTGTGRARKSSMSSDSGRDAWSVHDDIVLKKLFELYGANWTLIAQVFNSTTAVSRFVCKKRSPRQCYDRYGKIISGSLAASTAALGANTTTTTSKDSKSATLKAQRAATAANIAAAQFTPAVLDARIGLPHGELLLKFPLHHSLPGLPPPSITSVPSLVEMTLAHRKHQPTIDAATGKKNSSMPAGGLDDLKSIKTSFDAIIQCMKHKTSPPPIPIPVGTGSTTAPGSTAESATAAPSSTDLGTKASLTAASFPPSQAAVPAATPTKASPTAAKKATVSPSPTAKAMPVVVPPPHKSHTDMISLLPTAVLGPDEVIKRSKEAAVVAVQAAAAVASVGRDGSPLSASGDVMLGAGSGFGASVSGSMPRRSHSASITSEMSAVGVMTPSTIPATGPANAGAPSSLGTAPASSGAPPPTTPSWGGNMAQTNGLSTPTPLDLNAVSTVPGAGGNEQQRNPPMPVTTSTLLHVLDRMPEIKNKIQSILNRTDCSESQKVAMIARLLSNTNAINNTNALGSSSASTQNSNVVLSALTADAGILSSTDMLIDTDTPIPMPASLTAPPSNVATSSTQQGQLQPPASSQP